MRYKVSFIFFMAIASPLVLQAQTTFTQYVYWVRYQSHLQFSPALYWSNEFDNRRFFDPDVAHQFIIHSRVHYKKGRWDYAGGVSSSWAFAQIPENGYQHSTLELRPVVEASYEIPFKKWALQQRVRLDNRFFEVDEEKSIFEKSRYTLRARYRLLVRIPLKKNEQGVSTANLRIADEIMINDRENLFDQNRIYVNYDVLLTKRLTLDVGYLYIYQQRFDREDFFKRHVIRLSLLHKITLF